MTDTSKLPLTRVNELIDKLNEINSSISEINNKINFMKYVVESGGDENGWYRVWSDGWIEQGGQVITGTTINETTTKINFIKPFKTFVAIAGGFTKTKNNGNYGQNIFQNGETTLTYMVCSFLAYNSAGNITHGTSSCVGYWYACGY